MLCPECGAALTADFAACPYCGSTLGTPRETPGLPAAEDVFARELFRFPPLTTLILGVNVLLYILMEHYGGSRDELTLLIFGAKLRAAIVSGDWWRLLTADFLHIGFWHLLLNSITLIQLGMLCENIYGRTRFFILYVLTGMGGFLASTVFADTLSAGASASLFGLMGATLAFGWRHGRGIPPAFRPHFTWYLLPWVLVMIAFGLFYGGIDNWAHIGGLLSGLVLGFLLRNRILTPPGWTWTAAPAAILAVALLAFSIDSAWRAWREGSAYLAQLEASPGRAENEIEVLSRFIDADRNSGLYFFLRAEAQQKTGRNDAAEADFRRALSLKYDPPKVKNAIAWLLITTGDPSRPRIDEAARLAREAVQAQREPAFLNTLGYALYLRGDLLPAIVQLEASFKEGEGPKRALDLYMLAMAYHRKGDDAVARRKLAEAQTLYEELEEPDPEIDRFKAEAETLLAGSGTGSTPKP